MFCIVSNRWNRVRDVAVARVAGLLAGLSAWRSALRARLAAGAPAGAIGTPSSVRRRGALLPLTCFMLTTCWLTSLPAQAWAANAGAPAQAGAHATPSIVVLGDSLSAEYGIDRDTGWVALMRKRLTQSALNYNVVNASISGETTEGGLTRLPAVLKRAHPSLVIVELGANDALRGVPLETTKANLRHIIEASQAIGAKVVVIGMRIPPNFGPDYAENFFNTFGALARQYQAGYVPFLLEGIADDPSQFQQDQIHPTAAAQPHLLDNVWPSVQPLLNGKS
ncbi:MAG TPA: arylesterase [Pararobbsia sp.]|nr:arylesterase [Pararobbsia sp.]